MITIYQYILNYKHKTVVKGFFPKLLSSQCFLTSHVNISLYSSLPLGFTSLSNPFPVNVLSKSDNSLHYCIPI